MVFQSTWNFLWRRISLLTVPLYLSECFLSKALRSFCLFIAKNGQCKKKWSVFSVSEPQSHIGLRASLKLWRCLCSFRWLNINRNLDNNLTPAGSWIASNDFCFKLKKSFNIDLKRLIFSAFLREISNLHNSWKYKGKNDCLKFSVLVPNLFILLCSDALVL